MLRTATTAGGANAIGISAFTAAKAPNGRRRAAARVTMALAMGAVLAEISPRVHAQSQSWTGATSSDWNLNTNWTNNAFPNGVGTLGIAFINTSTGNIATVNANSVFLPSDVVIGDGAGASGRLDVNAGLNTGTGNFLYVGRNGGSGVLNIGGAGTLLIGSGTGGRLDIGVGTGSSGVVTINTTGTITAMDGSGVRVGDVIGAGTLAGAGTGVLNMQAGTLFCTQELWTGAATMSTGTTNHTGGTVTSNSWFVVGRDINSNGNYNLSGGTVNGAMTGGNITISSFATASGTITITGGLMNTANAFFVGEGGNGTLNLSGTGSITIGSNGTGLEMGVGATGQGTANLNGGTITLGRFLRGGGGGTVNFNGTYVIAKTNATNFMNAMNRANIRNGGFIIDSAGFNISMNQGLDHSDVAGDNAVDGGVTKNGAGSLTLNGVSSYTGPTNINGGALGAGTAGNINSTSGITVNGAGARFFSNSSVAVTPTVNVTNGSIAGSGVINTANMASNATNTVVANTAAPLTVGALTFAGSGNFDLTVAAQTPAVNTTTLTASGGTGSISVNASAISWEPGTYNLIGYSTLGGAGFAGFQKGTIGNLSPRQSASLTNPAGFIALSVIGENPRWTGNNGSDWTTAVQAPNKNWVLPVAGTPTDYLQGDVVMFDDNATNTTVNITEPSGTVSPLLTQFNNTTKNYTLNGPGALGGTGGVNKSGTGVLTINSANTYSGPTNFNDGQLNLNNNTALGTGTLNLTSAGTAAVTIDNTSGAPHTIANPQSWARDIVLPGTNALTFSGAIARTGAQTLTINGAPLTVSGSIGGTGSLTKLGSGTLVLSGANTYDARVLLRSGVISVTGGQSGPAAARNSENANFEIAPVGGDVGTLILSGGTLNVDRLIVGGNTANDNGGFGNFIMTGGVLNTNRWFATASQTSGQSTISGGTINIMNTGGGTQHEIAALGSGTGVFNLSGTAVLKEWNNNSIAIGGFNNTGAATLNHSGGTITFYSNAATTVGGTGNLIIGQTVCTGAYTYNFGNGTPNSATLSVGSVVRNTVAGGTSTFNWNGGYFRPTRNNEFIADNINTVNVGAGGAIVDTGSVTLVRLSEPLRHDASGPAIDGGLIKNGTGTLRLTAPASYTGATVINGGVLQLPVANAPAVVGGYSFEDYSQGTTMATGSILVNSGTGGAAMNGAVNDAGNVILGQGSSIVPGKFGNALHLDGLGSTVDIANQVVSQAGTSSWTLNAWVNTSQAGAPVLTKNNTTDAWDGQDSVFFMGANPIATGGGGLPTAVRNGGGFVQGNQSVTDGQWHMVTFVNNEGYNAMYVDGVLVSNNFSRFNTGDNSTRIRLGLSIDNAAGDGTTPFYDGSLDELKLYQSALNATQVSQLFSSNSVTAPSGNVFVTKSLSIATGAQLDLTNNSAVIDYTGPVGTLVSDTRQNLQSGKIVSSLADAAHRLGYGDNAVLNKSTFGGVAVDTSSILIKYTFGGDANLDGQVDVTDLGSLATNWQTSSVWTGGDFNYDGFVDVTDLGILATNWQLGVGNPLGPGSLDAALASVGLGGTSVPEPASLGLVGLGLIGIASRRRRRA